MYSRLRLLELALGLLLFAVFETSASADLPKPVWLGSLAKRCSFQLGKLNFDLCPIVEGNEGGWTVQFERRTPPTVTKTSYRINLRQPLQRDANAPEEEQCPEGTWICQTISNRRPRHESEEPRVLQVVPVAGAMHLPNATHYRPGVNVTAQLAPARENSKAILHIRLHGGHYMYGPQKADFQFLCDSSADEPSPTYAWSWNGTHTFQWRTKHACAAQHAVPNPPAGKEPPSPPVGDEDQDTPPPDDEEQELRGNDPFSRRAARTRMILLLFSATTLAALAYLAWRPPARVRQYISRLMKAHPRLTRFRVGERVLVRWAYEDLEMEAAPGYAPAEEDTMVNWGAGAREVGEGIPLKPSPRKGQWMNYGTT